MVKHRLHVWCGHITCYRPDHSDHADNTGYAVPSVPPGQQELLVNVTAWDQMIMNNVGCNVDCGVVIRLVRGLLQIAVIIIIILPV